MVKKAIFDKKNVLVTGGAGFMGSHLCDELLKKSRVICLDNFISGDEKNIDHLLANPDFIFIRHDINDPIDLESLPELEQFKIRFQGIQEIYHLACPMSPRNFEKTKADILFANSFGTKNALDLAVKFEAKFLHFSSSVIYGPRREENEKLSEESLGQVDTLSDRAVYDEGKRFAETMVWAYKDLFKVKAKILRFFRIYGPRMKLDDDQMIPDFISNALDDKPLQILGDEKFSSSFCYVTDAVDASIKMMESDLTGPYNIGSDIDFNITDLAKKIITMIGSKSTVEYTAQKLFMTPLCLPDITQVRNDLGWMPIVTLDNGLDMTINDLRAAKGLKNVRSALYE